MEEQEKDVVPTRTFILMNPEMRPEMVASLFSYLQEQRICLSLSVSSLCFGQRPRRILLTGMTVCVLWVFSVKATCNMLRPKNRLLTLWRTNTYSRCSAKQTTALHRKVTYRHFIARRAGYCIFYSPPFATVDNYCGPASLWVLASSTPMPTISGKV